MSAGAFVTAGYVATYNATQIHPIKVQPETLALSISIGGVDTVNSGATLDDINNPISAVVSRGRRTKGLNARLIRIKFGEDVPDGYLPGGTVTLPAVNPALLAAPNGAIGTYLTVQVTVAGTTTEDVR